MTKKQQRRRMEIIRQLSELSKDGWSKARYEDYAELEAELQEPFCQHRSDGRGRCIDCGTFI